MSLTANLVSIVRGENSLFLLFFFGDQFPFEISAVSLCCSQTILLHHRIVVPFGVKSSCSKRLILVNITQMVRARGGVAGPSTGSGDAAEVVLQDQLVLEIVGGPGMNTTDPNRNRLEKQFKKITIGRTHRGTTFTIKDGAVSEHHAVIEWTGEAWMLTDVGSSNGTFPS